MTDIHENPSTSIWLGHQSEARKSYRRKTMAPVTILEGPLRDSDAMVTNVSLDGAFLKTKERPLVGDHLVMDMLFPTGQRRPIRVTSRVVRVDAMGLGLRFEELQSRDRTKIRQYSGFIELDEVIVDLQTSMKDILSGNLLPVSEWALIEERLLAASKRELPVKVVYSVKKAQWLESRLRYDPNELLLYNMTPGLPDYSKVVYCVIIDGPLHSVFEGLLLERGIVYRLVMPERMYHNERRWSRRESVKNTYMVVNAPHLDNKELRLPVMDLSEGGCSVVTHRESVVTEGMRFPSFKLVDANRIAFKDGATIARVTPKLPDGWLLGLNFLDQLKDRTAFEQITDRSLRSNMWSALTRLTGMAKQKMAGLLLKKSVQNKERVFVVRYKNNRGDIVVALLDATFDLNYDPPDIDVAVVIGPPFPVRKEVFSLLARTLVDNFRHQGLNAVVLRFDLTHALGESEVDPEMEAKGHPYLRWTYSHLVSDMQGSLAYLERRFRPKKRVLVTYSVAAIAARRLVADNEGPPVDLFVAPFGCPDGQDMFKNLLAGVDLFPIYQRGEKAEPFLIYGRLSDPSGVMPDAIEKGMAFLEDARKDMEKIRIPVVWIVGTYDYMVTRSRVRQMLNAPGGGIREIIETPTGHNPRLGAEAIESFKLIFESINKHLYGKSGSAVEPDLALFEKQREIEWARTKRKKFTDATEYWNRHLFGTSQEKEGYDVLLYNPDYVQFIDQQVEAMDIEPGLRIADIGCGTGNLTVRLLNKLNLREQSVELTCLDLVPEAVAFTRNKIDNLIADPGGQWRKLKFNLQVVDLESARLQSWRDFLSGELFGLRALVNRIEGLNAPTIYKIEERYNSEVHQILRGKQTAAQRIRQLIPELDEVETEAVQELSMASRFLNGLTLPDDLLPGRNEATTAADLRFKQLSFGKANRLCRIDIPSQSFDRIGGSLILPYLYDPLAVLRELLRMLTPGGVLVLSSLKPNYDSSKAYLEEAEEIAKRNDLNEFEKERLLASLREFAAFVGALLELEDEGRFRFFAADEFIALMEEAGFINVRAYNAFGDPPTAVIVRAERRK